MNKIITVQKIGYNHPSQANWSYEVYSIGLIDTKNRYHVSYILKGAFTSDFQWTKEVEEKLKMDIPFMLLKPVYTNTGTQKITGVSQMINTSSNELLNIIRNFLTK